MIKLTVCWDTWYIGRINKNCGTVRMKKEVKYFREGTQKSQKIVEKRLLEFYFRFLLCHFVA